MTTFHLTMLALLQGITEFLPVSSSGHLILFSKFTDFPDQGLEIDVALHIGSIIAVMIYFWRDIWYMIVGMLKSKLLPNFQIYGCKVFYLVLIATIPALLCGLALKLMGTEELRSTKLIGWNILLYGLLLWVIDKMSLTALKIRNLEIKDAILIGLAQCLALLPGTSRSGITITMGRFLGLERREAAKFSMLLSIPTIIAAGLVEGYEIWQSGDSGLLLTACDGAIYSFGFSLMAIFVLMQWLKKWSFFPFVLYRVALGTALLLDAYGIYDIKALFS